MKLLQLIHRLACVIDVFLSAWPHAIGGYYLRSFFWKQRFAYCGRGVRLGDRLIVTGFQAIRIGDGTTIMSGSYLYADESSYLTIGSHCSFNHNVFLSACGGEIIIGSEVLIGPNVVMRAADHSFARTDVSIRSQGHRPGRIVIGDDVWLAANVVVTSGVTIGDGCVVGAGSIVTRDLPAMSLCVGNPAQPIRSRL
jgi:acetyltransferase-like isoleucine patch superfamily enzyme